MLKELYRVRVYYDVMVVADLECEFPINVAQDNCTTILRNESPQFEVLDCVSTLEPTDPWYNGLPYGKHDAKPCSFYTAETKKQRQDVVKKVKKLLSPEEWDSLENELKGN